MVLLGKIALGFGAAVVMMGAYTFRQGLIRIDVDETRSHGSHVHIWAPAAVVPMVLHLVPKQHMAEAGDEAWRYMPVVHAAAKELQKYPEAEFVNVQDGSQHAVVRTHDGSLQIDVDDIGEHVHVRCPLATIDDVAEQLASFAPAS